MRRWFLMGDPLNIHIFPEIKTKAEKVFNDHGLTLSETINVFIKHSCYAGGFPFKLYNTDMVAIKYAEVVLKTDPKSISLNIDILPEIKEEAERVFNYHGLTLSEAINVFIKHSCQAGGFPFKLKSAPSVSLE
jgi:addiction module RelB/DinJ family antitoxin